MIAQFFLYASISLGALLPIVNPLSTVPVFLSTTSGASSEYRRVQARMAAVYAGGILLVTLFAGAMILKFFGITLPILRMAGGLIILRSGFQMLDPGQNGRLTTHEKEEAQHMNDVALTPLAMPLLAGPGSMAVTISLATESTTLVHFLGIGLGIVLVATVSWLLLLSAVSTSRLLSRTSMNVVTRVMGLILVCIGIQFLGTGFLEALTSEPAAGELREWIRTFGTQ